MQSKKVNRTINIENVLQYAPMMRCEKFFTSNFSVCAHATPPFFVLSFSLSSTLTKIGWQFRAFNHHGGIRHFSSLVFLFSAHFNLRLDCVDWVRMRSTEFHRHTKILSNCMWLNCLNISIFIVVLPRSVSVRVLIHNLKVYSSLANGRDWKLTEWMWFRQQR